MPQGEGENPGPCNAGGNAALAESAAGGSNRKGQSMPAALPSPMPPLTT
jgi:hypothetical protein